MKIIITAYNQMALLKQSIKLLKQEFDIMQEDLVIIDHASTDGLSQWLNDSEYNFLLCDEEDMTEGYAKVLNVAIREFEIDEDLLLLTPNNVLLPHAIEEMQKVLCSDENIGAVSPSIILCGSQNGKDYSEAVEYVNNLQISGKESRQNIMKMGLDWDVIMLKRHMVKQLKLFDEELKLPNDVMIDYLFRGILKGYRLLECGKAFCYKIEHSDLGYEAKCSQDTGYQALRNKWHMNYFSCQPNDELISCIQKEKAEQFNVLEVGCDFGENLMGIKNQYPNAQLYGLELNEHSAEIASCFFHVETGNIEDKNVPFKDITYDYIIFGDVLEHLRDPAGTVHYCRQLLNDDGRIIACIPNIMHYTVMKELINGNFRYRDGGLLDRTHIHFFTYNEIVSMFQEEKYTIEKIASKEIYDASAKEFVDKLMMLSENAKPFMFYTFQYLIIAKKSQCSYEGR